MNGSHADVRIAQAGQVSALRQEAVQLSEYDASTVLVQFKPGLSDTNRDQLLANFDGALVRKFSILPGLAEVTVGTSVGDALSTLRASNTVISAEPNYRIHVADVPNAVRAVLGSYAVKLQELIQRGAAASVTSLMYLVPPCTALIAWLLFAEPITATTLAGTALTAFGVSLVVRPAKPA